jgi:hypothetical protein
LKTYKVVEGNTGILTLEDINTNEKSIFIPNYDFPKAKELYIEFSNYHCNSLKMKNSFMYKNIDFYPFATSWLYWNFFSQYVKYKILVDEYINDEIDFIFENNGKLSQLVNLIKNKSKNNWKHKAFNIVTIIINSFVLRKKYKMAFYSYGVNDFRTKDIKKVLENKKIDYVNVLDMIPKRSLLKDILKLRVNYIGIRYYTFDNYFKNNFHFKNKKIFYIAFKNISNILSDLVYSYRQQDKLLKDKPFDIFYGLDDCNNNIFPILLFCKDKKIQTIGHQHGLWSDKQVSYTQPIVDNPLQYNWYDKYIVWGEYWKEKILDLSNAYNESDLIVGCNKTHINKLKNNKNRTIDVNNLNILIPYEFLANTKLIGEYISIFIKLGHTIFFKPRVDEDIGEQLQAYFLNDDDLKMLQILEQVDENSMSKIDVVAGTFTTLLYDLMIYNKPLWILDTESKFLDELIGEDLAYKITFENVRDLSTKLEVKQYNVNNFYNDQGLEEVISKYVLGAINE